jgi:glycosyltransferase involved in cell wall biosynthesis
MKISVIVNTWNEEKNIERCLKSVEWVDEIVVVDMNSTDKTREMAKKLGAKVFSHQYTGYVEPARGFALSKATGDWILVLDADEEIPFSLAKKLEKIAEKGKFDFVRLPRKNIIFGRWVKHSRWWPDYNIRFFKKGKVSWTDKIHSVPLTTGEGKNLAVKETNAIIHHHYQSVSQYIQRLDRYTDIQSKELFKSGYQFGWQDIISKPIGEFLSRFFAGEGYKDGLHGLVLALLQAFSELIKYLKVWENQGFESPDLPLPDFITETKRSAQEVGFWLRTSLIKETKDPLKKFLLKIKQKLNR